MKAEPLIYYFSASNVHGLDWESNLQPVCQCSNHWAPSQDSEPLLENNEDPHKT